MRVLFVLKQAGYVRHFNSVVTSLAERGHIVRIAAQDGVGPLPEELSHPHVSIVAAPKKRGDVWRDQINLLRRANDYLRYLEPPLENAAKLRRRAFAKLLHAFDLEREGSATSDWAEWGFLFKPHERARLARALSLIETVVPADEAIKAFIANEQPDIVLITPLIDLGSGQTDFVKAAQALDIPIAMALFSWDNLSTKGRIHVQPDRVFVWNELQKQEAMVLHGTPADRVRVTGAPRFDRFFALAPSLSRPEFCAPLGFDPERPIVLYLGSSNFVADEESAFMARWIDAVRSSPDDTLRHANLLIKPHPDQSREWKDGSQTRVDWPGVGTILTTAPFAVDRTVVVRSPFSAAPFLYECLHHSVAAVGLNTSAELEAAILGKPVYTIALDASIAAGQVETIHFHYLLESNGGFVRAAPGLDEHVRDLAEGVHGRFDHDRMRAFIEGFVRPGGLSQAATPLLVHEIEALESEATRAREVAEKRLRKQALKSGLIPVASEAVTSPAEPGVEPRRELSSSTVTQERRVMVDYPRDAIWITVSTPMEQRWRAKTCAKEPFTVDWIERELRDNDVFYDIGANVGVFSLIAARRTRGLTAVAFEPGYASYARLCDNIVLNACDHSIIPIPLPLADHTGLAGFKYRSLHAGQSRHTLMDSGIGRQKEKASPRYTQPVLAMRLDDVVSQFELPAPTHIKLDVDGAELRVLHGASKTLKHSGLKTIFAEVDRPLWDEVTHLLAAAGFRMAERHARETKKPDAPYYGFFTR